ncbi:hypothetical protein [uncultured Sulfitobacter sp.]|uniref:hypothetical protein n=1 Tax=uncultured Sulfitobacter sp. TaxID=191468 RepID=UPI002638ED1F|nr:hypothetical protein [uncultured Sulfitobacter sp.]
MKEEQIAIFVAPDHKLVLRSFYREHVWLPAREANEDLGSSKAWLSALELIYDFHGMLFFNDGLEYPTPDIPEVFVDHSNRWMRNFLKAKSDGTEPKHFSNKIERLRIIELYCRLINQEGELT